MPETTGYQPDARALPVDVDPAGFPPEFPEGVDAAPFDGATPAEQTPREQIAVEIAETARDLFDHHVEATVAALGDKVQNHVRPTIERVVGSAKETIAATGNLQAQTTQLQEAATSVRERLTHAEGVLADAVTQVDQKLGEADEKLGRASAHLAEVDEKLRVRTGEVED